MFIQKVKDILTNPEKFKLFIRKNKKEVAYWVKKESFPITYLFLEHFLFGDFRSVLFYLFRRLLIFFDAFGICSIIWI